MLLVEDDPRVRRVLRLALEDEGYHVSEAATGETLTTSPTISHPFEAPYFTDYVRRVRWTIETRGTDSFDVAAVTVSFTYLTPQA